jgi:hypothetical protein
LDNGGDEGSDGDSDEGSDDGGDEASNRDGGVGVDSNGGDEASNSDGGKSRRRTFGLLWIREWEMGLGREAGAAVYMPRAFSPGWSHEPGLKGL